MKNRRRKYLNKKNIVKQKRAWFDMLDEINKLVKKSSKISVVKSQNKIKH